MSDRIKNWVDDIRAGEKAAAGTEKDATAADAEMERARAAHHAETAPAVNRHLAKARALAEHMAKAEADYARKKEAEKKP